MKAKGKRDNNSKSNKKQTKINISKKFYNSWQNKNGANTLIKPIKLMEVTARHNFIRTRASDLVFWNLRVTGMQSFNKKWYHWKKELIEIGNLHMFWTSKNYLSGRKHCLLHNSTLYVNGFCNSEQFVSICLDYVYQLVESVVSHGKYEDDM